MKKFFNVSGNCSKELHYMVDITSKLRQIKDMVDRGEYFTINRARQYGKTTTLKALAQFLKNDYLVISLDFQMISTSKFKNENIFALTLARKIINILKKEADITSSLELLTFEDEIVSNKEDIELAELFEHLSNICTISKKPIVLMIDEVDSASNNQVFLDFLALLRGYYINREELETFQSVILAGVYDVKNIKRKLREEDEHKMNSPWNIASDFLVDMSFSKKEIVGMLTEYENDYHTKMNIENIAELLYEYTSGYPYLVSRICKLIDERIAESKEYPDKCIAWTKDGFLAAVKLLLNEKNTLFESLVNKLTDYPKLREMLYAILFQGKKFPYNPLNLSIEIAELFGFVKNIDGSVAIANRIFETVLYNMFLSEEILDSKVYNIGLQEKNQFIQNGHLNMELILEKFIIHFHDLYADKEEPFLEDIGRRYFLLYLKLIINGVGNYYIEAQTRNMERTDVIVDYLGEQFIIEMKIWHGNSYHTRGEAQLAEYLEHYHLKKGYMLSFNFNKNKQIGIKKITVKDKILVEAVV